MQKPVLAYDVGGICRALHDGVTGLLVGKGDITALAGRLQDLLQDENVRSTMGRRGREFVIGRFSLEALAARHERFYAKALNLHA